MTYLPARLYSEIERSIPIACVDFVLVSRDGSNERVGLILRESPFGRVWCHLGGRIQRGETIAEALQRHARDSVGVRLSLDADPQPHTVYQWFPGEIAPSDGTPHGDDPRKHAIGLSYVATFVGAPKPKGEALDFGLFELNALPSPLWPGSRELIERLFAHTS